MSEVHTCTEYLQISRNKDVEAFDVELPGRARRPVSSESTDTLVVGAGPVGLTAALEPRRRGVDVAIVDLLTQTLQYAKAVGIQPRNLGYRCESTSLDDLTRHLDRTLLPRG